MNASGDTNSTPVHPASSQIDKYRYRFLLAVESIQKADAKFRQLARNAEKLRGAAFNHVIEEWAIECHLATRPAKDWWIVDHVAGWLSRLATDPPDFGGDEEDIDAEETKVFVRASQETQVRVADYYSYTSIECFVSLPQELPFRLYAYDPANYSVDEYKAEACRAFTDYLDVYVSRLPKDRFPETLEMSHYDWLVRHQMLGETYSQIAASVRRSESTIKTEVNDLRTLIALPAPRKRGRPKKLLVGL